MDKLSAMKVFVRVAEAGSFAAVATQLGLARSVVTRQVAALESSLGTKLIARSTRRLALTSAGALYLEKCREILTLVEEAAGDHGVVEFGGHTHGEVHALGDQIDAAVAEIELDIHVRMRDGELANHGRQIPDPETQGHGQANVAAYVVSRVGEIALRLFDQREYLPAFF